MHAVDTLIKALSDYVNDDIAAVDNKDVTQADIDNCCDTLIKALSCHVAQWAKQAVDVSVLISVKNIWLLDNKIFLANGVQKYFIYF